MQPHGPDPLTGPLRGTSAWWHGRQEDESQTDTMPNEPTPEPAKRRARRPRKIRNDLVQRVRAEITAGTYDTPDKFQAALERLLERMWD